MSETGLSDFHKMVVTLMKTNYRKLEPKIVNYSKYKDFPNSEFRGVLKNELFKVTINKKFY